MVNEWEGLCQQQRRDDSFVTIGAGAAFMQYWQNGKNGETTPY